MGVDLSQFHQVFIEESVEGLDVMESALMELDHENIDQETINAIFRSAHSIKGGGATFGFTKIAEFTHVLETLLDQIRSGKRGMTAEDVNLFLQSVDCMRDMLSLLKDNQNVSTEQSTKLKAQFEHILNGGTAPVTSEVETLNDASMPDNVNHAWAVNFIPGGEVLKTGNDPLRIFSAIAEMATLVVKARPDACPSLSELDPECLFLSWALEVNGSISKETILEQFDWVADESDITIKNKEKNDITLKKIVKFIPNENIFHSGNEPLKLLQGLKELDPCANIKAHVERIPSLKLLNSESCFLSWEIVISSKIERSKIESVFEWVDDLATLTINPIGEPISNQSVAERLSSNASSAAPEREAVKAKEENVVSQSKAIQTDAATKKVFTEEKPKKNVSSESSSIRVGIDKIDNLINMVGELVITQSMLGQLGTDFDANKTPKLIEGLSQLEQNTRELQESVMRIRMLPISFAFSRFPRMVRDLGQQLGKKIHLEMLGEQTELDKTVMEKIGDPLVHLVRNAIDHGIETEVERARAGKSGVGNITLNAYHQGGNVVIEIVDDGKGLDREMILRKAIEKGLVAESDSAAMSDESVYDLIFQPGFSTASQVSDVSGRGVGMDVVKRNIQSLNGIVEIHSKKGEGSKIRIRLPLTLAILDGQLIRVGANIYIFPLVSIVESMQCKNDQINHIAGNRSVFRLRDDYVPIVHLNKVFSVDADFEDFEKSLMVVVESDGHKVGIVVDELLAQQQVVIKSLEQNYRRIEGVSGATILGDGTVALIVDIPGVVKLAGADGSPMLMSSGKKVNVASAPLTRKSA